MVLLVALAAHFAYARLAVPLIEPLAAAPTKSVTTKTVSAVAPRIDMLPWFVEGDWELDPLNKILETPDGILVLQQYHNQPDGTVVIEPCTMIFLAKGAEKSAQDRAAQATILQAPQAVLRLDQPLDLKTGRVGRLIGGRLDGPVSIRSRNRLDGPEDDLDIRTKNIEMTGNRMVTDETVDFRLGPNHGHGKRLRIELLPGDKPNRNAPTFNGIKSLELLEDVWMHLDLKTAQRPGPAANEVTGAKPGEIAPALPGKEPSKPAAPSAADDTIAVEVSCRGRFRFDMVEHVATFAEKVHVLRVPKLTPTDARGFDQLDCQQLSIYFTPIKVPGAAPTKGMPKLAFERLLATGQPVMIRSPARKIEARGGILEWTESKRTLRLSSMRASPGKPAEPAWLAQGSNEITTDELECQMDDKGGILKARATGQGKMRGVGPRPAGGKPVAGSAPMQATWQKELTMAPEGDLKLVRLMGEATVSMPESGQLAADEIYLWLADRPAPRRPPGMPAPKVEPGSNALPHKMAARGRVEIESQPLVGRVTQLEVWFDHREAPPAKPAPTAAAPRPSEPAAPGQAVLTDQPQQAEPSVAPKQRFFMQGELLRARMVVEGKKTSLGEAWMEGQVRVRELVPPPKAPVPFGDRETPASPLVLTGDTVHLVNDDLARAAVRVTGQPGHFEGQGLTLEGAVINVSQAQNRLWVDGPGLFRVPVKQTMAGLGPPDAVARSAPIAPTAEETPLEVRWQGSMVFDGLEVRFREQVKASLPPRLLLTPEMVVRLTQRFDFTQPGPKGVRPEIETVACPEQFQLDSRTMREKEQVSVERMEARGLLLNQKSGGVTAQGPGTLVQVRRGGKALLPGVGQRPPAAAPIESDAAAEPEGLNYLSVQFLGGLAGNMFTKEMAFQQQVETLYGPLEDWEQRLSVEELRPTDMWLRSERLSVRQSPVDRTEQAEMEAEDNVRVRSREFTAWGGRMSFSQAKDLLILEGDTRTEAQLSRQPKVGGPIDRVSARKIYFWPSADHVKLEGSPGAELGNLGGGGGGSKEPPPARARPR